MYLPRHFQPPGPEAARALVRAYPLAQLVWTADDGTLAADPVPMLLDDDGAEGNPHGTLRAHVARANPLWRLAGGRPVMALFGGPQGYVSPNWYPSKAVDGKAVPTWNYAVVQVHGTLHIHDDAAWLRTLVTRLTEQHEAGHARPWQVADAPADYLDKMFSAIVGISIPVARLDAKFKLSQNHAAPNFTGVLAGLAQRAAGDDAALAALMQASR